MSQENSTWGAPRILSDLLLLVHDVAESTVDKYMIRQPKPPSQNWGTFLKNHVGQIAAIEFFTVPTITFRMLYVFLVLRHDRRRVVHFNVTTNPTAQRAAQQILDAFPFEDRPRFLLRDRDGTYGEYFRDRVEHMGIEEALIAPRAPWQNPYCERIIGSVRRECLDHIIVLNENHLNRILAEFFTYYHEAMAHLSLDWTGTRRLRAASRRLKRARLWPRHIWAACTIAIRGQPDERTETSRRIDGGKTLRRPGTQGTFNCSRA
jgi:transposase InsO family protein